MTFGRVANYDANAGYGFIEPISGDLIYFHYTSIKDSDCTPGGGMKVTFDVMETTRGLEATNVQFLPY